MPGMRQMVDHPHQTALNDPEGIAPLIRAGYSCSRKEISDDVVRITETGKLEFRRDKLGQAAGFGTCKAEICFLDWTIGGECVLPVNAARRVEMHCLLLPVNRIRGGLQENPAGEF